MLNSESISREDMRMLGLMSIALMCLVILVSFIISIFVVSRTNNIAQIARNIIETGDLSRRITVDNQWDDLSNLAAVLNELLDRIEVLMEGVKRVSDNIAHDLRTPLARMRNQLELLAKEEDSGVTPDKILEEADQLLSTFSALLRIANIETGKRRQQFSDVNLHTIVQDVIELYAPLAEEKHVTIVEDIGSVSLKGDRDLLFQTVANLLDNAIKFTPPKGAVILTLHNEKGQKVLRIGDSGMGVSEVDKEKMFDRFYRADASRNTPGSGLGLSLVIAVVELHNATIHVEDNDPGVVMCISF